MKIPSKNRLISSLVAFLELQFLINLASLPILAYWGLPISLLSPIGNLFFTPLLTLFLVLSTLLFFASLLHIPCSMFVMCLEYLHYYWSIILNQATSLWLISCIKPSLMLTLILTGSIVLLYQAIYQKKAVIRFLSMSCALLVVASIFYAMKPTIMELTLPATRGELTITKDEWGLYIVDKGCFASHAHNFITYTFMGALRSHIGSTHIERWSITKPTYTSFALAQYALEHCTIKTLYVPYWQQQDKKMNGAFIALKNKASGCGCTLVRMAPLKKNHQADR